MITGRCDYWDGAIYPIRALMPIPPFRVPVVIVHKGPRMKGKSGPGCVSEGFPKNSRPMGSNLVLSISEIDEAERFWTVASSLEVILLCPVESISDPVGVKRIR